jgi:hypothetical protein
VNRRSSTLLASALFGLAFTAPLAAQSDQIIVQVTDIQGNAIPFAVVQIGPAAGRVANDSGRVVFQQDAPDSLRLTVRRIGFQPFIAWVKRKPGQDYFLADMIALPRTLDPVNIAGRRDTPLARTGFYDRAERIQKGAYAARVITPEELEVRNPMRVTQLLTGDVYVKVTPSGNGRSVLLGRGMYCAMTILLDGQRVVGTYEEAFGMPNPPPRSTLTSIDDVVNVQSIAAVEIYGSVAAVPIELQRAAGTRLSQGCGLIALWTGSRR